MKFLPKANRCKIHESICCILYVLNPIKINKYVIFFYTWERVSYNVVGKIIKIDGERITCSEREGRVWVT